MSIRNKIEAILFEGEADFSSIDTEKLLDSLCDVLNPKTDLEKLGTMIVCPKCSFKQFSVSYKSEEGLDGMDWEAMSVQCKNCGYARYEAPLNIKHTR